MELLRAPVGLLRQVATEARGDPRGVAAVAFQTTVLVGELCGIDAGVGGVVAAFHDQLGVGCALVEIGAATVHGVLHLTDHPLLALVQHRALDAPLGT